MFKSTPLFNKMLKEFAKQDMQVCVETDFDDLVALNELSRRVSNPASLLDDVDLIDGSVTIGNVTLMRMSEGASIWLKDVALPLFDGEVKTSDLLIAYAMAEGRDPRNRPLPEGRKEIARKLKAWRKTVGVSYEALMSVVLCFMGAGKINPFTLVPETSAKVNEDFAHAPIVAALVKEYGENEDYWLFGVSKEKMLNYVDDLMTRRRNEWRASLGPKSSNKVHPDEANAYKLFKLAVNAFKAKKAKERGCLRRDAELNPGNQASEAKETLPRAVSGEQGAF